MDIERYVVTTPGTDDWGDGQFFDDYDEAKTVAMREGACVVTLTFEFSDSELTDDFRDGVDTCESCGTAIGPFCQVLANEEQAEWLHVDADEDIGVRLCPDCTEQADAVGCDRLRGHAAASA